VGLKTFQVVLIQARLTRVALGNPLGDAAFQSGDIREAHVKEDLSSKHGANVTGAIEDQGVFGFNQGFNAYFQATAREHDSSSDFALVVFIGFPQVHKLKLGVFQREQGEQLRGVDKRNGFPRLLKELFKHW